MHLRSVIIFCFYLWQVSEAIYANWALKRLKNKIFILDEELCIDAIVRRSSINHLKAFYDGSNAFQVAEYAYTIKKKYNRMIFIYLRCNEHRKTFTFAKLMEFLRETQHIKALIDNMILMLEEWEDRNTRQKTIARRGEAAPRPDTRRRRKPQQNLRQLPKLNVTQEQISKIQKEYDENNDFLKKLAIGNMPSHELEKQLFQMKNERQDDEHLFEYIAGKSNNFNGYAP